MSDITKELLKELEEVFNKRYSANKKIKSLLKKLEEGKSTAQDAFDYSKEVGNIRKNVIHDYITDEILDNEYLGYYNAKALFDEALFNDYELINRYCKNAFTQVNKEAGIGLRGVSVDYDQDRTDGIVECAVKDKYTVTRAETEEAVVTNAKSYYDISVRKNAEFQYKSGLSPKIIRTAVGKTCKWCQSLAGTYDYYDVSDTGNDVFRRHSNCDCIVVYSPRKGRKQNVWTKEWNDKVFERIEYNRQYSDNVETNRVRNKPEIVYQDKKAVKELKKDFKGYTPAKLVNGSTSGCNMRFESNNNGTYRIVREVVNTAIEAGDNNVDLKNPALANSYHERGHDIMNCLAIKRAGITYENMVTEEQISLINTEYKKISEELYVAAFPYEVYGDISYDSIIETIVKEISSRAADKDELGSESFVKIHDNNQSEVAKRVYNYIKEEWNK